MKVSVFASQGEAAAGDHSRVVCLTQCFAEHAADVQLYGLGEDRPPSLDSSVVSKPSGDRPEIVPEQENYALSDVCIFLLPGSESWLPSIPSVQHGIVILDFCGPPREPGTRWLHHADLCFASTLDVRAQLIQDYAMPTDRVYLISTDDPACCDNVLAITTRAREGNLEATRELDYSERGVFRRAPQLSTLRVTASIAEARADVAMRNYAVRSQIPLLGPIVAWVRRQLTSHLREPYLDRIVERQVAFNRAVVAWMEQSTASLSEFEERLMQLERQLDPKIESDVGLEEGIDHGGGNQYDG